MAHRLLIGTFGAAAGLVCVLRAMSLLTATELDLLKGNKTVKIGVIGIVRLPAYNPGVFVDRADENAASINQTIELAMRGTNKTKYVKMFPVIRQTQLQDSFRLRTTLCNLAAKQTLALLGTSKSHTFNVIQSFSRALQLPVFLLTHTRGPSTDPDDFVINMCPSFIDPVIDFIKYMQWDRVFYLFDTEDGLWRLQKLYQAFNNGGAGKGGNEQLVIDTVWIPDVSKCREILRRLDRLYDFPNKRIIVDLNSLQEYNLFMKQIIDVGMNRDGYHYLLGTLDIKGMQTDIWKSFNYGGVNITGFQLINRDKLSHVYLSLTDFLRDQQPSVEVALTVDAVAVLTTAIVQIMQRPDSHEIIKFQRGNLYLQMDCNSDPIKQLKNGRLILDYIRNVTKGGTHPGISGVIAFDEFGNRVGHTLDLFHLSYKRPLRYAGYWRNQREGNVLRTDIEPPPEPVEDKKENRTRIVITVENKPFVVMRNNKTNDKGKPLHGNDRFEGFCVDMIEKIAQVVNFSYSLQMVKDDQFGSYNKTLKRWNGLIGDLIYGRADIALASLTINHKREEVVRFTKPFMNTGISIMIRKPEKEKPGVFSFMEPLSYSVWACIMAGFFAVSFVLYMVGRFSPYEWQEEGSDTAPSDTFSFINTLWFSLGALMQQGPDIFPRSLSGRVLGSAWWFFTLIMISSYTANLAAFLTFERLTTPINSADDLVKQTKIKYGTRGEGSTHDFFKESKVPTYETMYKVMEDTYPNVYVKDEEEGLGRVIKEKNYAFLMESSIESKVPTYETMYKVMEDTYPNVYVKDEEEGWGRVIKEKNYAFLMESSTNMYYNQRKPCKTMKVGRNLDQKGYGLATPKSVESLDFSEQLNIAVLEMRERGDLLKLEHKWWYSKGECGSNDGSEKGKSALNLSNVSGIFHILIGGLVLAMVISLSQIVFHAKIKPKRHKDRYRVSNPPRENLYKGPKRVTIEEQPPVITCTTSNGGEPHLITFDNNSEDGIISLDKEET